jgi:hypothetical protein
VVYVTGIVTVVMYLGCVVAYWHLSKRHKKCVSIRDDSNGSCDVCLLRQQQEQTTVCSDGKWESVSPEDQAAVRTLYENATVVKRGSFDTWVSGRRPRVRIGAAGHIVGLNLSHLALLGMYRLIKRLSFDTLSSVLQMYPQQRFDNWHPP